MRNFTVVTECPAAGGGEAFTKYCFANDTPTDAVVAAQLIALHQYFIVAANTKINKILKGAGTSGPTLPVPFPVAAYEALSDEDSNIIPMTEYGTSFGLGTLAVAGSGAVISRRSATPGRSGRGRLTTPWLGSRAVTDIGELDAADAAIMALGLACYLDAAIDALPDVPTVDLLEVVAGADGNHAIVARTISPQLGRLRSRRQ